MPIIIGIFCILPLLLGLVIQYLACRFFRKKLLRLLPLAAVLALTAWVAVGRIRIWEAEHSPLTQLLFIPCLPALCALAGMLLGWRLWKKVWGPKVVWEKKGRR